MTQAPHPKGNRQHYINDVDLAFIEQRRAEVAECMMQGARSANQVLGRMQKKHAERSATVAASATGNFDVSHRTITRDMAVIEQRWTQAAADKIESARATQLAQHQEIINALWDKRKEPRTSEVILKALSQVAMLTGTNKPVQHEISMPPELIAMLNARGVKIADVFKSMMAAMLEDGSAPILGIPDVIEMPNHVESN